MNKKIIRLVEPGLGMFLFVMVAFAAVTFFFYVELALVECGVIFLLVIYSLISARRKRRALMEYIESVTYNVESAKTDTLLNFPLPMVVFTLKDYNVVWGNQVFFDISGGKPHLDARVTDLAPAFSAKWLLEGKSQYPGLLEVSGRKYQIHGNIVRSSEGDIGHEFMGITYWMDVTDFDNIKQEYSNSRPVVAIIILDNYDELLKNLSERMRSDLRAEVEDRINQWAEGKNGFINRPDRDKYIFIFEERYLAEFTEQKFALLESVHSVVNPSGIHATVSIGIGRDGSGYEENYGFASMGIEMALSRGGDQAVIKNRFNFEFFGGRGTEIETRTKVKSRVMANALYELIGDASQVFVMGHKHADYDSVGGAVGICCIARKRGVKAQVVMGPDTSSSQRLLDRLKTEDEYKDVFISPQDAILQADSRSLLVVVDTDRPEQVEDESLLMACNRVAVIDHHRRAATFIQNAALTFYEPYASSVCELLSELLQELVEHSDILRCEAEAMLSGIVMDTKNFTIRTGERTFDAAAFLKRAGADTTEVKRLLQNDIDSTVARYKILQSAKVYRESIAIAAPEVPQDRVVAAQAADELLNVSGIQASIVVYPTEEGGVTISARSIGDFNVQVLLEVLGGGGNKSAAGAQLADTTLREAVNRLFKAIDDYYDN